MQKKILSELCAEMFNVKPRSLSALVPLNARGEKITPGTLVLDTRADARARKFLSKKQLAPRRLALREYITTYERYVPLSVMSEEKEGLVTQLHAVREATGLGNLGEAAALGTALRQALSMDNSAFARRLELYADMAIASTGRLAEPGVPAHQQREMRHIAERWIAQDDWLNAAVAVHDEALVARTRSFLNQERSATHIREALCLLKGTEDILTAKCWRSDYDRWLVALVLQQVLFNRIRFKITADEHCPISDEECKVLRDVTDQVGGPLAKMDQLRALSAAYLANGKYDQAAECIDEGCRIYDSELNEKSSYTLFSWLARILKWWIGTGHSSDPYDLGGIFRAHWMQFPEIHFQRTFGPAFALVGRHDRDLFPPVVPLHFAARTSILHIISRFVRV